MAAVSRREVLRYGAGLGVGAAAAASGARAAVAAPAGNGTAGPAATGEPTSTGTTLISRVLGNVFVGSEVPAFEVRPDRTGLRWTARDLVGVVVAGGKVSGGRFEARVPDRGWYAVEVADAAGTVLARDTFALLAPYRPEKDSAFGVNTHLPPAALVPLLARLGTGWARVDLTWADVEPAPLAGWTPWVYQVDATVTLDTAVARTGRGSAKIVNRTAKADNAFASLAQQVTVEPHTTYTLSAWVKGEDVRALQFTVRPDWGDRVDAPSGTFDWTRVTFEHTTGTETDLTVRVLSNDVTTAAWLDDLSVTTAGGPNLLANPGFEAGTVSGFTFAGYDPYVTALHRYGIRPLAILDYANPKYDAGLTPYDAAGRAAFARYAAEVVRHYRGAVTAVEVYNEYNAGWFTTGPCSADPSCYQELLRATYQAVKAVDPAVTVVGGVTYGTALDWLTSVFDQGGAAYLDAVSNHPYTSGAPDAGTPLDDAERQVTALVERYTGGAAKPVWISELGWSLADEPTTAAYLVRGAVLALAAGVARYFWYDLVGDQNFGLLDQPTADTYAPRPAFVAYSVLIRQLAGRALTAGGTVAGVRSYVFSGHLAVLWTGAERSPVTVAAAGPVTVTDVVGTRTVLHPAGGAVRLTLTGSPLYLEPARAGRDGQLPMTAGSDVDATAPRTTLTSAGALTLTYLLDNGAGHGPAEAAFVTFRRTTTVRAAAGTRVEHAVTFPLTELVAGRNTIVSTVRRDGVVIGRLVSGTVLIDVPADPVAVVGAVDWSDSGLALAPAGYASLPSRFAGGVDFTAGVDDPATGWPYIHPGPDDGWAGGTAHAFTLRFTLPAVPAADLRLVVFLLDTHNTAPGTVDVACNGGPATTVTLPAGSGSGATEGSAFTSGDRPTSFTVPLPAARLVAGANAVTLTKSSGSWMVYDALGVYR